MIAMMMALTALSIDVILPAFDDIREEFGLAADSSETAGIVTAFFLGLAVPQMLFGPLSDRFGRKPLLYVGFALFAIGATISATATSLTTLLIGRFVWGFGAAGPRVITLSIIRDTYEGERMARVMSFIFAVFVLVPIVAPSIGAGVVAIGSWRWAFWFCLLFMFVIAAWTLRLRETLEPAYRIALGFAGVRRAVGAVLRSRQTMGYLVTMSVINGVFLSYLATSELIWEDIYDRGEQFPIIFGGIAIVLGTGMLLNGFIVERVGIKRLVHTVQASYIVVGIGLLAVALATEGRPNFWLFVVVLTIPLYHQVILIPNLNSLAMTPVGQVAGTAAAVIGTISTAAGALFGFTIDRSFNGTITPLAIAFVAAGVVALVATWVTERGDLILGRAPLDPAVIVPPLVD